MREEFEILISKDGQMKMTAIGFKGASCLGPLKRLIALIAPDATVLEEGKTWEYYQTEVEVTETLKIASNPDGSEKK